MMEQSVRGLFEVYLSCSDLAEASVAVKARAVRYFVELHGDLEVGRVRYAQAEDYRGWLGKHCGKGAANTYIANFRPFWGWLVKRGLIAQNPFEGLALYVRGQRRKVIYSAAEIERMLRVSDTRWQAMILLGLLSMRRAEVLNLTVRDIDFGRRQIYIRPKSDTEHTWRWDIKNHNEAIVGMPETITLPDMIVNLHRLLAELIEWLPAKQPYVFLKPDNYRKLIAEKPLRFDIRNNPYGNFSRDFTQILKRANVERKRFHDLRGTFATSMSQNLSLPETQRLMRHSSVQTTARYYIRLDEEVLVAKSAEICEKCYA